MKATHFPAGFLLASLLAFSHSALAVETIDWQALMPPIDSSMDPFQGLAPELQDSLYDLWMIRGTKADGFINSEMNQLENEAIAALEAEGVDVEKTLRKMDEFSRLVEANDNKLVAGLDGKDVRIPGYVLPTEFSAAKIVEFLLVPYVGACIHTPPPPANQMVHVKIDAGMEDEGLFVPVWVTGRISTDSATRGVSFSDGAAQVQVGYSIVATKIEPFEN
jgi:uncharacterized protein